MVQEQLLLQNERCAQIIARNKKQKKAVTLLKGIVNQKHRIQNYELTLRKCTTTHKMSKSNREMKINSIIKPTCTSKELHYHIHEWFKKDPEPAAAVAWRESQHTNRLNLM